MCRSKLKLCSRMRLSVQVFVTTSAPIQSTYIKNGLFIDTEKLVKVICTPIAQAIIQEMFPSHLVLAVFVDAPTSSWSVVGEHVTFMLHLFYKREYSKSDNDTTPMRFTSRPRYQEQLERDFNPRFQLKNPKTFHSRTRSSPPTTVSTPDLIMAMPPLQGPDLAKYIHLI